MKTNLSERVALGPLLTLKKGKKPESQSSTKEKGMQPYVDIKAFETGVIDNYTDDDKCVPCNEGDLLIVCDGSRSGYVGRAIKGYTGSTLAKISAEGVENSYLYYFIQSMYRLLNTQMKGTGTPHLNVDVLRKAELVIPSLKEQKRIVNKIEELFSELDSAVETLKKTKEQLAVYRQSVLKAAFEKAGNQYVELKNLIEKPKYGTSKKCECEFTKKSIAVFRIPNIDFKSGVIDQSELKYAVFLDAELTNIDLKENDLLIIRSNGSVSLVGRSAVVRREDVNATYAGYLMRLRLLNPSEPMAKYLHYFLESHDARIYIENVAKSTSGVNNINSQEIANLKINICDDKRVKSIVTEIEESLSLCRGIEKTVNDALAQAEALRQSILKKAFEGGL